MSESTSTTIEESQRTDDSAEDLYEILASTRRQHVLAVLSEREEAVDLSELATEVAERETGGIVDDGAVEEVRISLHHTHLPKLADVDVIAYRREVNRIEPIALPNSKFITGV